jgi:hypothetical protein
MSNRDGPEHDSEERRRPRVKATSSTFERRWLAYALAAGSSVAVFGPAARADIVYTPAHVNLTNGALYIDINHGGVNDFELTDSGSKWTYGARRTLEARPLQGGGFLSTGGRPFVPALNAGAVIGPGNGFRSLAIMDYFFHSAFSGDYLLGQWVHVNSRYLGLRFSVGNGLFDYGWAEFNVITDITKDTIGATLLGYAYETQPDVSIEAGQTGSPVPEPGTLGLLAAGAAGLAIWRRQRSRASA